MWLLGEPFVVYRADGRAVVLFDRCPHRRAPLSSGSVMDGVIECAYHGWRFDPEGRCVDVPSSPRGSIPANAQIFAPRVLERNGLVFVALDEPLLEIPEIDLLESPTRRVVALEPYEGRFAAALLIDNQLDISHFSFIHRATFGVHEEPVAPQYEVERTDWGFCLAAEVPISAANDREAIEGRRPLRQYRTMQYRYVAPYFVEITLHYPVMGGSTVVTFFAQPERAEHAKLYVTVAFSNPDGFSDEELAERVAFERKVIGEDLALQARFDVLDLPLGAGAESHVRADRASIEYRRILTQLLMAARASTVDVD